MIEFTILDMASRDYNVIIGRPTLSQFEKVVSLIHLKMKSPTRHGTGEIQGNQKKARGCYLASTKRIKAQMEVGTTSWGLEGSRDRNVYNLEVPEESPKKGRPHEEIWSISFDERDPVRVFKIGTMLGAEHEAMLIRELLFPTWLADVVVVPKPNGTWRMCTDFTSINKACPMDCYPLPNIDRLVDSRVGYKVVYFLDAFRGYH
ncbi:hypothetical protein LIER_15055 [Lithospermum erythrorhizon]|uniref:Uncharacterized protein n=1 Tax=Lithospermum erythrorhizon TaxID=34254 RepID=A0AAV3Q1D0_LITER